MIKDASDSESIIISDKFFEIKFKYNIKKWNSNDLLNILYFIMLLFGYTNLWQISLRVWKLRGICRKKCCLENSFLDKS